MAIWISDRINHLTVLKAYQQAVDEGLVETRRGIGWLIANQNKTTGAWPAWSLNKNRDPKSDAGLFMSDAATGYAVLALENQRR